MGVLLIVVGNLLAVYAPAIVRDGIDFLANSVRSMDELKNGAEDVTVQQPTSFRNMASWIGLEAKDIALDKENFSNRVIRISIYLGLAYLLFFAVKGFLLFWQRQALIVMSRYIEYDLKNEVYDKYQQLDYSFYKRNRTGDLMNRISEDVSRVRMYTGPALMYTINLVILFVMCIVVMLQIDVELTLYTLSPLPFMMVTIFYVSNIINRRSDRVQEHQSLLSAMVQESVSGIRVIKAFGREAYYHDKFEQESNDYKKKQLRLVKADALFIPVIVLLIGLSTILTMYVGAGKVMRGEISPGVIVQFVFYVNILTWPFAMVGWVTSLVQKAEASQKRINEFLKTKSDIENTSIDSEVIKGDIVFDKVTYVYPDSGQVALKNLSFALKQGETLGIVGRTGSGKSTLVNLLLRMMDAQSGQILIDGKPIEQHNLHQLRKDVGYVPQEVFLFSDTVRNNIAFGMEVANEETILQASEDASIHENILGFEKQYETQLGERGINVSGGQKQRLSIARAIVKNPQMLIFDDCLSAVDTQTEEHILNALQRIMRGKTSIIISHRISSVKAADKIIVLDHGSIAEQGTHDQLLARGGIYASLHRKQQLENVQPF
jgi:ATP-binding cassette subfamily B multidrug efflux pump